MGFEIMSGWNQFPVENNWWARLADYSRHIAPTLTAACRYWYSNDGDGLSADQARRLGAELQRSVDDCSIDAYARQLFKKSVPRFVWSDYEIERRFVNQFIGEVQRFIEFLLTCDGFEIR
jgi:hypothetical protein